MRSSLILALLALTGCFSNSEQQNQREEGSPPLSFRQLTTRAHTLDGQSHLTLHVDTARRDSQHHTINAHGVRAILTHRNTHTMTIDTPVAVWDEHTRQLSTTGTSVIQHPHGTLQVDGGTNLRLDQHHLFCKGPLTHTLTF